MTADFCREWIAGTFANSDGFLMDMSARYEAAAREMSLTSVPMFFALKHGNPSSDHYRTLAHVFEVILCDLPEATEVKQAVHDVVTWYWATRAGGFTAASIAELLALGARMRASLSYFEQPEVRATYRASAKVHVGPLDKVPKVHRAVKHLPEWVRQFGPYEDLTTEQSEAANKPLKQMFRTCVNPCAPRYLSCVRVRVYECE